MIESAEELIWENARIVGTDIGYEDHGIMTAMVEMDMGDSSQGFGGHNLNDGNALSNFIKGVLAVVGKKRWEDVSGNLVRIGRHNNFGAILAIRPIINNAPIFMPGSKLATDPCLIKQSK